MSEVGRLGSAALVQEAPAREPPAARPRAPVRPGDETGRQAAGPQTEDEARVRAAIARVEERIPQRVARDVRFVVDRERDRVVIEVVDREKGQVLRRIPPEELLALADTMEELRGLLLRDRA
ncbi:MAG TPA: flagellar protein FlaG [Chromatiales bacterium]|nr:flagellar protein FlaG [Chromatiales bacterium]